MKTEYEILVLFNFNYLRMSRNEQESSLLRKVKDRTEVTDKENHSSLLIEHGINPNEILTPQQVIMKYRQEKPLPEQATATSNSTETLSRKIEKRLRLTSLDEPLHKVSRNKLE